MAKPTALHESTKDPVEARVDLMMDVRPSAPLVPGARTVHEPVAAVVQAPAVTPDATITVQPLAIDTPDSDAAIEDIVAQEADEVLAAQDAGVLAASQSSQPDEPERLQGHPFFWFFIILLVILIAVASLIVTSPGLSPSFLPQF